MNKYLNGTILEMLERVKTLKTKIRSDVPQCFHQLAVNCTNEIDNIILNLEAFISNPKYQVEANLSRKLIDFQEEVKYIDYLENKIVVCVNRSNEDDEKITSLIQKICKEINYPLIPPVASRLSQEYYCIDTKFNHMRVPLLESEFLLHMPDLYHELAHPIIAASNDPRVIKFQEALVEFIDFADNYCQDEIKTYRKNNGTEQADFIELFSRSWVKWAIEFFCDLYATYTLGSAYAWANLHLCIKRGSNPFETPFFMPSSHPADDARMQTILNGLELLGLKDEGDKIEAHWKKYVVLTGNTVDANFKLAYPKHLLEHCASLALNGTKAIKSQIANPSPKGEISALLNSAWGKFIDDPLNYIGWEKLQREKFDVL
jgi:hypothetical protein